MTHRQYKLVLCLTYIAILLSLVLAAATIVPAI